MASFIAEFLEYEKGFNGQVAIDWTAAHAEVPIYGLTIYLWIIFYFAEHIKKPLQIRTVFAMWNLLLSAFSILGASRCIPMLYKALTQEGFTYTVCTDPKDWYLLGSSGLWTALFVWSKLPELLDTVFLVVQKKRVIFLHWFHHVTVLLYCWHSFAVRTATGLWFVTMNFSVHSVMYLYYFIMILGYKELARKFAMFITIVQLSQMVVGSVVTGFSAYQYWYGESGAEGCHVDPANFKMGLGMYLSYFMLFAKLFWDKYFASKRPVQRGADKSVGQRMDAAGHFRSMSSRRGDSDAASPKKGK